MLSTTSVIDLIKLIGLRDNTGNSRSTKSVASIAKSIAKSVAKGVDSAKQLAAHSRACKRSGVF